MSHLSELQAPEVPGVQLGVGPSGITMAGTITTQDPSASIGAFLKKVHEAAIKDQVRSVHVDITALTFVNSSAIRMFIDWATWVRSADEGQRYQLDFKTSRQVTWQRTSFVALKALAPEVVSVHTE